MTIRDLNILERFESLYDLFRAGDVVTLVFGLIFALIFFRAIIGIRDSMKAVAEYKTLPDLASYLSANPSCKTPTGPKCKQCQSNHFGSYRVFNALALTRLSVLIGRVHFCKKCETPLYRT